MKEKACDYFLNKGYSCSESILAAAADEGLVIEDLINTGTGFSGGMNTGCLCGAAAGAQIVIGWLWGKNKTNTARTLSKKFIEKFKSLHGTACCRALTSKFSDFHSQERKNHCVNMVESASKILEEIIEKEKLKTL